MKNILLQFLLVILLQVKLLAQSPIGPPSLSAGVGGLVFEQGNLDANLIAEIVAMKQGEIKSELAKRLVLERLQCGNFAFYNYAKQNLDVLLSETHSDVIKKEVLQNSAELAMVIGIAELYLADVMIKSKTGKLTDDNSINFFREYVKWLDASTIKKHLTSLINKPDELIQKLNSVKGDSAYEAILKTYNIYQIDRGNYVAVANALKTSNDSSIQIEVFAINSYTNSNKTDNYFAPVSYLKELKNMGDAYKEKSCKDCSNYSPNQILIDLVFDICRKNEWVHKNGFFVRPLRTTEEEYMRLNKFHALNTVKFNGNMYNSFKSIEEPLTKTIDLFFKYFYTITKVNHDNLDTAVLKVVEDIFQKPEGYTSTKPSDLQKDIKEILSNKKLVNTDGRLFEYKLDSSEKQLLVQLLELTETSLYKNKGSGSGGEIDETQLERALYTLREDLIPRLSSLNINTGNSFADALKASEWLYFSLGTESFKKLQLELSVINIQRFNDFKKFFQTLGKLNEAETYDALLKMLGDIGNIYTSKPVGKILNTIVNAAEKYTIVDKDNNLIHVDVESMAVDLFKRYGEQNSSWFSMYFSVGVNNAYPLHPKGFINDSTRTPTINFVSEKLGFKFKLLGVPRYRSLGAATINTDRKPIISDWHIIAYGSGLLYQIKALTSEDSFNKPIAGINTGLTFFNGLDLNIGYAVPITDRFHLLKTGFWSIGFDIKIIDYLSALRLKNKTKQKSK